MKNCIVILASLLLVSFLPISAQNNNGGVSSYQLLNEFRRNQKKTGAEKKSKKVKSNNVTGKNESRSDSVAMPQQTQYSNSRKRVTDSTVVSSNQETSTKSRNEAAKGGVKNYLQAAEEGNANAQFNLGMCYYYGDGVEQDYQQAIDWLTKAGRQDHGQAQLWLGKINLDVNVGEANSSEAAKWLKKAANKDIAEAQYLLALLYKNGNGVLEDPSLARQWMEKAASNGWKEASKELENL